MSPAPGGMNRWRSVKPHQPHHHRRIISKEVRYNTACDSCRSSRVKCSGGSPCDKCAFSVNSPSSCVYSISKRRGKHRAIKNTASNAAPKQQESKSIEVPSQDNHTDVFTAANYWTEPFQDAWLDLVDPSTYIPIRAPALSTAGIEPIAHLTTINLTNATSAESLDSSTAGSSTLDPQCCDESPCIILVHQVTKQLGRIEDGIQDLSLSEVLTILDLSYSCAARYLSCCQCDHKCRRLMNLAMLLQQLVNTLCHIVKAGPELLTRSTDCVSFSGYYASRDLDLQFKRSMLPVLARNCNSVLQDFRSAVQEFEDGFAEGSLKLAGAGRHSLDWLLNMGASLSKRMKIIGMALDSVDWEWKTLVDGSKDS